MRGSNLDIELGQLLPRLELLLKGVFVFGEKEGRWLDVDVYFINRLFPIDFGISSLTISR